jgi:hypothetical protein
MAGILPLPLLIQNYNYEKTLSAIYIAGTDIYIFLQHVKQP